MVPYELFFYEYSDLGPASERLLAGDAKWLGPWIVGYAVSGLGGQTTRIAATGAPASRVDKRRQKSGARYASREHVIWRGMTIAWHYDGELASQEPKERERERYKVGT